MKRLGSFLILALLLSLVSVSLSSGAGESNQKKVYTATIDKDGVQRVAIVGGGYFFDPNYIIVKVNVPVEFTVTKESGFIPHNIVMHSPEAGMEFSQDLSTKPQKISFTPTKTGTFPFYCDKKLLFFKSHRDKGMEGTLEVRE